MRKKAILINPKFLPEANGVIACLKNISPYFANYFDLTIVTTKTVSKTKKDDAIDGVKIKRISSIVDDLYVIFKEQFYSKSEEEKILDKSILFRIKNIINAKLMHLFENLSKKYGVVSLDGYEKNFYSAFNKLKLDFDYIICPVMPRVNAFVAMQILKKYKNAKMVFLQLDLYSRNPDLQYISRNVLINEQKSFYEKAAVVTIQPGLMQYIDEDFAEFKDKILPLHVPSLNKFFEEKNNKNENEIKVVYAGSFLETVRPPRPMLEFFRIICETNKNVKLHLLSWGCSTIVEEYKNKMGEKLILHGFLPMEEASVIIESADILVNIGNTLQETMPSKTFEYIGRRKPIIHFFYAEDDVAMAVLKEYPMRLFVDANNIDSADKNEAISFIEKNSGKLCDMQKLKEKYTCYTAEYYVDTIAKYLGLEKE